jgi:hypothetical protein
LSTAYHPQTDGETKHVNQEVETYLWILCGDNPTTWSDLITQAEFAHNHRPHSVTGTDDLDSPPSSPSTQTLDNEPAISWRTNSPPLPARSNVYHIQAINITLYASKLRSNDASSEALNKLRLYLHDARYTKDIYAHANVDSPLHSLYNTYIHTSRLEGIASNLRNSPDSHSAFLSS